MLLGRDFVRALKQLTNERGLPEEVISSSLEAAQFLLTGNTAEVTRILRFFSTLTMVMFPFMKSRLSQKKFHLLTQR